METLLKLTRYRKSLLVREKEQAVLSEKSLVPDRVRGIVSATQERNDKTTVCTTETPNPTEPPVLTWCRNNAIPIKLSTGFPRT